MTQIRNGRAARWFASLATGTKMLLILGLALLPLGIIAILASVNAAQSSRSNDEVEAQAALNLAAQRLLSTVTEAETTIRVAHGAVTDADPASAERACQRAARQWSQGRSTPIRFALYGAGNRLVCRTPDFTPPPIPLLPPGRAAATLRVDAATQTLAITLYDPGSGAQGHVELPVALLAAAVRPDRTPMPLELELIGDGGTLNLFDTYETGTHARELTLSTNLGDGRLELRLRAAAATLSWLEVLGILLPVLMWLFSAVIGWLIVDRLLLRPLGAMQKAVAAYRPGDKSFEAPGARSPAREIADLGEAFDQVTRTVARHEAEQEAAVERQKLLVREVHHRVKNNLQVVASLLNIHSRGSASVEAAAAYASIQRRVDALAVVHRNHYAELEKTPGVALRALISELGASLRASAPAGSARMQIRLALQSVYTNQDVAVSVAFLVTEAVEFAMLCGCNLISIALEPEEPGRARLTIETEAFTDKASCAIEPRERFERIITGLARQLRSTPDRDAQEGRFSLQIAIVGQDDLESAGAPDA